MTPEEGSKKQLEALLKHDAFNLLPNIKVPTLVLAGEEDVLIPPENSRVLSERIPDSQFVIFKNAGHGLIFQVSGKVIPIIQDFLKKHS